MEAMGIANAALLERPGQVAEATDQQLVTAVRRGDDRAFESLYSRYQRRIAAYVYGMVKDHGRAEDITQEVFVSALRRMRQTERPIAFKPWIYEIAKNACIDAHRRGQRAEEVSFDAGHLSPDDYGRLAATGPEPDAAIDVKQDLEHLCGAFGGLSETYHKILVLREFEGLSYSDIGERLGLSRGAVESTLFRARKRLGEEYDEIASGARCLRVEAIIANAGESRLGLRDQRRLARHVSHCQPCRRLAAQSGLDIALPVRTRVAGKIPAWLPIPAFLRMRRGGGDDVSATAGGSGWALHGPAIAESMQSGWTKAVAGMAALIVAGAGVGVTTSVRGRAEAGQNAPQRSAVHRSTPAAHPAGAAVTAPRAASGSASRGGVAGSGKRGGSARRSAGTTAGGRGSGGSANQPAQSSQGSGGGGGSNPTAKANPVEQAAAKLPTTSVSGSRAVRNVNHAVQNTTQTVNHAVQNTTQTVNHAVQNTPPLVNHATQNVTQTVDHATQTGNVVPNTAKTVTDATHDAGATVGGAVQDVGGTVGGLLKP